MAKLNVAPKVPYAGVTHEGAPAARMSAEQALRRSVLACLLWEDSFYEDGDAIGDRIVKLAEAVPPAKLAEITVKARTVYNLRHVPLLLLSVLARTGSGHGGVSEAIYNTIQRADELAEFLAVYAKANGVTPDKVKPKLSAQVKKGLARAFTRFDEYQLGKYDREGVVRLRDALFLCHAKPLDKKQAKLWKQLCRGEIKSPDTWEVALSGGASKKETFERLLRDQKLGYFALLRNLRNMAQAGVDTSLVREALLARKGADKVLPFRYIAAARACPQFEPYIDQALSEAISAMPPLTGKTVVLVDVSRSMEDRLSAKSDLTRMDAAAALASMIHGDLRVFTFSDAVIEVPARRGMAGVDAIRISQSHMGTRLFDAVDAINRTVPYDRIIVITDEQAEGAHVRFGHYIQGEVATMPRPKGHHAYVINVSCEKNGVGYGPWFHIDGFSEAVLRFISEVESGSRV